MASSANAGSVEHPLKLNRKEALIIKTERIEDGFMLFINLIFQTFLYSFPD
jgi:hypothetical protein